MSEGEIGGTQDYTDCKIGPVRTQNNDPLSQGALGKRVVLRKCGLSRNLSIIARRVALAVE